MKINYFDFDRVLFYSHHIDKARNDVNFHSLTNVNLSHQPIMIY